MSGEAFASPLFFKNFKMAHLITVTNSDTKEDILFNLDTVVSIEQGNHNTVITTRWGRTMVKDSLEDILEKANPLPLAPKCPTKSQLKHLTKTSLML